MRAPLGWRVTLLAVLFSPSAFGEASADPPPQKSDRARPTTAMLVERGDAFFANGDVSAARLLYLRAAAAGDPKAALAAGRSYDPNVLARLGTRGGITADPEAAAAWYRKAASGGASEAAALLDGLARPPAPAAPGSAPAPERAAPLRPAPSDPRAHQIASLHGGGHPVGDAAAGGGVQVSQFQVPRQRPETLGPGPGPAPGPDTAPTSPTPPALIRQLPYEYTIGSESDVSYRKNEDLDRRLRDEFTVIRPEINGAIVYRPFDWLETKLALILDAEFLKGEREVLLPSGEIDPRPDDKASLLVDEAYFTIHNVIDPFSLTLGRRNYEDERHWLFDSSLDVAAVGLKQGRLRAEASFGREAIVRLDPLKRQQLDRVNTYMLYADYRALEGVKLAGYGVMRDDKDNRDGLARLFGLRAFGYVTDELSFWSELAIVRGRDEVSRTIRGWGFDVGATYRITSLPFAPSITLGYAVGSGDSDPDDGKNTQFRQTGLQSNEARFAGLSDFRYYGEALDPELSNLRIFTAGLGFRVLPDVSVDFVFHKYRLASFAESLRNAGITAEPNQDPSRPSYDIGTEFDIVVGFRNFLGVRKLGIDLRAGRFYPGDAFRNDFGDAGFDDANFATSVVVKLWW
jgi:alginate production protein